MNKNSSEAELLLRPISSLKRQTKCMALILIGLITIAPLDGKPRQKKRLPNCESVTVEKYGRGVPIKCLQKQRNGKRKVVRIGFPHVNVASPSEITQNTCRYRARNGDLNTLAGEMFCADKRIRL